MIDFLEKLCNQIAMTEQNEINVRKIRCARGLLSVSKEEMFDKMTSTSTFSN